MVEQLTQSELVKLDGMVREAVDSKYRQQAEVDFRKEVAENAKETFGMASSFFNDLVNERYNEKLTEIINKKQEIIDLNDEIMEAVRKNKNP